MSTFRTQQLSKSLRTSEFSIGPSLQALRALTRGVTVEGQAVGSAAGETGDNTGGGEGDNAAAQGNGAGVALEGKEVGAETSDMGAGHGGTRDAVL